ncbi:hypothetical protein [Microcoleus sp. S1D4]|uniref:hypothetical protein n=1 Tax=unclassified Microcoleus TaxID=2642155 RepID=UPI003FA54C2A
MGGLGWKFRGKNRVFFEGRSYWLLVIGYWFLVIGYWLLVVGCWLLVVSCWLLVVSCWLLVVSCWLLVLSPPSFPSNVIRKKEEGYKGFA